MPRGQETDIPRANAVANSDSSTERKTLRSAERDARCVDCSRTTERDTHCFEVAVACRR
jgi:hypothetical protein